MKTAEVFRFCLFAILLVVFFNVYFISRGKDDTWSVSLSTLPLLAVNYLQQPTASTKILDRPADARSVLRVPMWSPIIENTVIAYSAHWDIRKVHGMMPPFVRLHAFVLDPLKMRDVLRTNVTCRFWDYNGSSSVVPASFDRHLTDAMPLFILCPCEHLVEGYTSLPQSVSLECAGCESHWTFEVRTRTIN